MLALRESVGYKNFNLDPENTLKEPIPADETVKNRRYSGYCSECVLGDTLAS
jgi:hypothetical protein